MSFASGHRRLAGLLRASSLALPIAAAIALSGCAATGIGSHGRSNASAGIGDMSDGELQRTAQYLGQRYQRNPDDKQVAIQYAQVLVGLGRTEQAVAVLQRASIRHPKDREVYSAYGKVLVADGKFTEALKVIDQVQTPDRPDWRLYSAKGTILDQMGEHGPARENYELALKIVPGEPSVLSNLGLSYALTGDLDRAENYLRQASNHPEADSRVRQNLALVLGLKGDFAEAERIARSELSPEQAEANVAYLRQMLSQQDRWKDLKAADKKSG